MGVVDDDRHQHQINRIHHGELHAEQHKPEGRRPLLERVGQAGRPDPRPGGAARSRRHQPGMCRGTTTPRVPRWCDSRFVSELPIRSAAPLATPMRSRQLISLVLNDPSV